MDRKYLSILLAIGTLTLAAGCHRHHHQDEKIALKLPQGTPKRPQGATALTVHAGAQPFTLTEVADYFKTHNLPKNGSNNMSDFQASTLEFLTSKEVTQRLQGEPTGLEDNDRIGFVTLIGQFVFTGPSGKPARFTRAYAAFDAVTGNLLMIGTLDEQKPIG